MDNKGGTTTTIQNDDPWNQQQPYLQLGFQRAEQLLRSPTPQYFPHSTVTPFHQSTEDALQMQERRAREGSSLLREGQGYAQNVLQGDYLGQDNPYMKQLSTSLDRSIRPGIESRFEASGRKGSLAEQEAMTRAMSDAMAPYLFGEYGRERGLQQQMASLSPTLAAADYADPAQLAAVGARREAFGEAQLGDQIARHDFEQLKEANKLAAYMQTISGNYGGTQSITQPYFRNQGASALGGALSGAALGRSLGSENPWLWAGAGGLLGMY